MKATSIVFALVFIAGVSGYALNIGKLIADFDKPVSTETAVRAVGIFVLPVGAVAGYF